jgi:predicted RNA binding protein YcfA (HicA-like mRNA interferase family)
MSKLPRLSGKKLIAVLKRAGFDIIRIRGSHHFLQHPDGRRTVVPVHAGEHIGPGLFLKILSDCEITREEFERLV